jgi:hypothetical protein
MLSKGVNEEGRPEIFPPRPRPKPWRGLVRVLNRDRGQVALSAQTPIELAYDSHSRSSWHCRSLPLPERIITHLLALQWHMSKISTDRVEVADIVPQAILIIGVEVVLTFLVLGELDGSSVFEDLFLSLIEVADHTEQFCDLAR